nr:putative intein [Aeromonas phage Aes508]
MIEFIEFEIEDLGVMEIDVYDIEVDGNHNFFGNDILVHNS